MMSYVNRFKCIKSNGKVKFIISENENYFKNDIFLFLNIFSKIKHFLGYFSKLYSIDDLLSHLDWLPSNYVKNASYIILGQEELYRKATLILKKDEKVIKLLYFNSTKMAEEYACAFAKKLDMHNFDSDAIENLKIEEVLNINVQNSCVEIESRYQCSLKKLGFKDRRLLIDSFLSYLSIKKYPSIRHADFKVYNVRKTKENKLFLYDLESLCEGVSDEIMFKTLLEPYSKNMKLSFTSLVFYYYIIYRMNKNKSMNNLN